MAAKRDWVFTLDKKKLQFLAKLAWAWYIVFQKSHVLAAVSVQRGLQPQTRLNDS
jgi:hypothetical protein